MKAQIKTDFEKWLITQLSKEGSKYYIPMDSIKVYFYFEGQEYKDDEACISMRLVPINTIRAATATLMHTGYCRFYCYGKSQLIADKIVDKLSALLNEKTIDITGSFRIETDIVKTKQRNKFANSVYFEDIADIDWWHWSHV